MNIKHVIITWTVKKVKDEYPKILEINFNIESRKNPQKWDQTGKKENISSDKRKREVGLKL